MYTATSVSSARGGWWLGCRAALLYAVFIMGYTPAEAAELPGSAGATDEQEPPPAALQSSPAAPVIAAPPAIFVDPKIPIENLLVVATRAFNEEQYEVALAYLSAAYARTQLPPILFNIGQTQRKAGYPRDALATYRRFLEIAPQSPLAPEANAHIAAMQAKTEAEQATQEKAAAERHAHDLAAQAERLAKERTAEREQAQRELRRALASKDQPLYKRKWFWGLVGGLVGTTLVVGLGVGLAPKVPPEPVGELPTQQPHF